MKLGCPFNDIAKLMVDVVNLVMLQYKIDRSATLNQQNKLFLQYYGNYFGYGVQMDMLDILGPQMIHCKLLFACFMRRSYSLL